MVYEDPRFPNRKRKDREQPRLDEQLAEADLQGSNSEETEGKPLPVSGYHAFGSAPESPADQPVEAELDAPIDAIMASEELNPIGTAAKAVYQSPPAEPPIPQPTFLEAWIKRIRKFAQSPTRVYAAAGVGLGILLGVVIATISWFMSPPNGRYDLGSVASSAVGLKGHLFIQWDKKLDYRLMIEPSDPDQQAGFALAVANPPRPLSAEIHLQNSAGFVLCSTEIVLKYDARNGSASAASAPDTQEAARELGKDVFQNQIGPDGQIAAINAQGETPCSAKDYENTSTWSFTSNFPSLAEQDELLKRQEKAQANTERPSAQASATRKRMVAKAAVKLLPFSIEGDDAIVEFDASNGIVETRWRKSFFVDKTSGAAADSRWQDFPVSIHYKCDRSSDCILVHSGLGALRARLR